MKYGKLIVLLLILVLPIWFIIFSSVLPYFSNTVIPDKSVIKENTISKDKAEATVVTFGERLQDDRIYYIQWESLSEQAKEETITKESIFVFSQDEFKKSGYRELLEKLIEKKKTILFYGYKVDVESVIGKNEDLIPYYLIQSTVKLDYHLYGTTYSAKSESYIPVTIMGNFDKSKMATRINDYFIKITNEANEKSV